MPKKTLRELENDLIALRADAADYANHVRGDTGLTAEGAARQMAGWSQQRRWDEQLAAIETQMTAALESARTRAAAERAKMTGLAGTAEERTLAELRQARRAGVLDAAIETGPAAVANMLAQALPEDVALLAETVSDRAATSTSPTTATGLREAVEDGLRTRSAEYAAAAQTAGMVDSVRHVVDAQLEATREALTNPYAKPPSQHSYAAMSVDVGGPDFGDLTP